MKLVKLATVSALAALLVGCAQSNNLDAQAPAVCLLYTSPSPRD